MWLSLFLVAFLVAAVYIQAIQGLTSAAIMCILTVLCMALAFGSFEYVAEHFLMGVLPNFAYAIALVGLFVIPLIIIRLLLDEFVSRASLLPFVLDRVGGAAVGICSAVLMTGMLAIGIELIPWGAPDGVLGFCRFDPDNPTEQRELWLSPDRTVAHLAGVLSKGTFSGSQSFWEIHPDFITEIGLVNSGPRGVRLAVPRDSVSVVEAGKIDYIYDYDMKYRNAPTFESIDPKSGFEFLRVTLGVSSDTAGDSKERLYTPASVRVIGTQDGEPEMYPAVAIANPDDPSRYIRSWKTGGRGKKNYIVAAQIFKVPSNDQIEIAFEVPKGFETSFVAYKFGGRAPLSKRDLPASGGSGTQHAAANPTPAPVPTPPPTGGGRVSGVRIKFGKSHFGPELPLKMTIYSGSADVRNGVLSEGNVEGRIADQDKGGRRGKYFDKFEVPADKRLLHLNVESLRAGSLAGKVLNYAVRTVENYILEDDRGHQLTPVGKYVIAKVGGQEIIELQYNPQVGGRVKPFSRIKPANLKKDYQLVYLYLMDSGAKAMRFVPSGGKRSTDLSGENLVAP